MVNTEDLMKLIIEIADHRNSSPRAHSEAMLCNWAWQPILKQLKCLPQFSHIEVLLLLYAVKELTTKKIISLVVANPTRDGHKLPQEICAYTLW